ncbi:MAG: hypothetical protein K6F00_09515 [Lachnospiraceae bacterium]|nr:hypothetical protein [Lachnospiraceae bacterium]
MSDEVKKLNEKEIINITKDRVEEKTYVIDINEKIDEVKNENEVKKEMLDKSLSESMPETMSVDAKLTVEKEDEKLSVDDNLTINKEEIKSIEYEEGMLYKHINQIRKKANENGEQHWEQAPKYDFEYKGRFSKMRMRDLEAQIKLLYNDKRNGKSDSQEMKTIKNGIKKLYDKLDTKFERESTETGFDDTLSELIDSMEKYENSRKPFTSEGKRRKGRITKLRDTLEIMRRDIWDVRGRLEKDPASEDVVKQKTNDEDSKYEIKKAQVRNYTYKEMLSGDYYKDEAVKDEIIIKNSFCDIEELDNERGDEHLAKVKEETHDFLDKLKSYLEKRKDSREWTDKECWTEVTSKKMLNAYSAYFEAKNYDKLESAEEKYEYNTIRNFYDKVKFLGEESKDESQSADHIEVLDEKDERLSVQNTKNDELKVDHEAEIRQLEDEEEVLFSRINNIGQDQLEKDNRVNYGRLASMQLKLTEARIKLLYNDKREKKADSPEMEAIKENISAVYRFWKKDFFAPGSYPGVYETYNEAIKSMQKYENSRNPFTTEGKRRKKRVTDLRISLENEKNRILKYKETFDINVKQEDKEILGKDASFGNVLSGSLFRYKTRKGELISKGKIAAKNLRLDFAEMEDRPEDKLQTTLQNSIKGLYKLLDDYHAKDHVMKNGENPFDDIQKQCNDVREACSSYLKEKKYEDLKTASERQDFLTIKKFYDMCDKVLSDQCGIKKYLDNYESSNDMENIDPYIAFTEMLDINEIFKSNLTKKMGRKFDPARFFETAKAIQYKSEKVQDYEYNIYLQPLSICRSYLENQVNDEILKAMHNYRLKVCTDLGQKYMDLKNGDLPDSIQDDMDTNKYEQEELKEKYASMVISKDPGFSTLVYAETMIKQMNVSLKEEDHVNNSETEEGFLAISKLLSKPTEDYKEYFGEYAVDYFEESVLETEEKHFTNIADRFMPEKYRADDYSESVDQVEESYDEEQSYDEEEAREIEAIKDEDEVLSDRLKKMSDEIAKNDERNKASQIFDPANAWRTRQLIDRIRLLHDFVTKSESDKGDEIKKTLWSLEDLLESKCTEDNRYALIKVFEDTIVIIKEYDGSKNNLSSEKRKELKKLLVDLNNSIQFQKENIDKLNSEEFFSDHDSGKTYKIKEFLAQRTRFDVGRIVENQEFVETYDELMDLKYDMDIKTVNEDDEDETDLIKDYTKLITGIRDEFIKLNSTLYEREMYNISKTIREFRSVTKEYYETFFDKFPKADLKSVKMKHGYEVIKKSKRFIDKYGIYETNFHDSVVNKLISTDPEYMSLQDGEKIGMLGFIRFLDRANPSTDKVESKDSKSN